MQRQRKYRVSGEDEYGDLHPFETDREDAARDTYHQMQEDLQNVEFAEAQPRS